MDGRLPLEILGMVLSEIEDLATLKSAILTCRRMRDAFASVPSSVLAKVVWHHLGEAIAPAALRLVLTQLGNHTRQHFPWHRYTEEATGDPAFAAPFWARSDFVRLIAVNAMVMMRFEDFFSRFYKDRSSHVSKLTTAESRRFALSMYRVWFFFEYWVRRWEDHYGTRTWDSDGDDSDGDSVDTNIIDDWAEATEALTEDQSNCLRQLTGVADHKKSEFTSGYAFLFRRVLPWVATSLSSTEVVYAPSDLKVDFIRLSRALAYREERADLVEMLCVEREGSHVSERINYGQWRVLARDIQRVSAANQLPVSPVVTYKCVECWHKSRIDAFMPCDAEMLSGEWAPHEMAICGFRSRLASNLALGLSEYFDSPNFSVTSFLAEIFDAARKAGDRVDGKAYYCLKCLVRIVSKHKEACWLEHMHIRAGASGGTCFCEACRGKFQDCPLGHTCIKQGTDLEHARTFNHFCQSVSLSTKELRALDEGGVQALFNDHAETPASPNNAEASSSTTWQSSVASVRSKWYLTETTNTTSSQD